MRRLTIGIALTCIVIVTFSCRQGKKSSNEGRLKIVCTTSMIGESVSRIVGDSVELTIMMGPGVDPHLYKPTPSDLKAMDNADVIIMNGLHLEGKMTNVLEGLKQGKSIIYLSDLVHDQTKFINNTEFDGAQDPHFWFDTDLWSESLSNTTNMLQQMDKKNADYYYSNWKNYEIEINETEKYVSEELGKIPASRKVLITSHDAFSYLGRKFNIEVKGLQGISTVVEFGLKDISNIVDFIVERNVQSIFVESTVSDKSMRAVVDGVRAKGGQVSIGGTLFGDALGEPKELEGTYCGMLRYDAKTIAVGLK